MPSTQHAASTSPEVSPTRQDTRTSYAVTTNCRIRAVDRAFLYYFSLKIICQIKETRYFVVVDTFALNFTPSWIIVFKKGKPCCLCFTADSHSNDKMKRDNWTRTTRLWCLFFSEYLTRKHYLYRYVLITNVNRVRHYNLYTILHYDFLTRHSVCIIQLLYFFSFTRKIFSFI